MFAVIIRVCGYFVRIMREIREFVGIVYLWGYLELLMNL